MDYPTVTVSGGAIRRFRRHLSAFVDEYRLDFTDAGLVVEAVDPANVAMAKATLDPAVAGSYPDGATEIPQLGISDRALNRAVSPAHKGQGSDAGDPVDITYDHSARRLEVGIEADRGDYTIEHGTSFTIIDPDSVRHTANVPDLDLPATARVPRAAFEEATAKTQGDGPRHVKVDTGGSDLMMRYEYDTDDSTISVANAVDVDPGESVDYGSLLSCDYVSDIRTAVRKTKPERVSVLFGDEFPVKFSMEWPELGLTGAYMISPRVQSE